MHINMKPAIYDQHDKAFSGVSAYCIARDGNRVATLAFKFPRDGAGRLYAYVHWIGDEMVRGSASGYGYDKRSAACRDASRKAAGDSDAAPFWAALESGGDGIGWQDALRKAGFDVWSAV